MKKNSLYMKGMIVVVIVLFIGMVINPLSATLSVEKSSIMSFDGNTLYVGGNGPGNYTKIQDAIDDANNGDTVFVYNGTYYENVWVDKSIWLIGEDKYNTIIDGCGGEVTVGITADNVIVNGFTITNATFVDTISGGIRCSGYYANISGNIIRNNRNGVVFFEQFPLFKGSKIIRNNITSNKFGVFLIFCNFALIKENNFINNSWNAKFDTSLFNRWDKNYWESHAKILPIKIIFGVQANSFPPIPWINIDFHPRETPYAW